MLPIVDKPAIQYIVEEAARSGIESIIVVTGWNKRSIEDHFDHFFGLEQTLLIQGTGRHARRAVIAVIISAASYSRRRD
ncbi:hypothetical protein ABD86_08640 [Paenibacillus alvei]|nr:hypothetical protein [Paenibacillus alvei]MBG9744027.1 hypothetical protein [Paenibacillus alvei]